MRRLALLTPLLVILVVMLCVASLTVNARAEGWSWIKVADDVNLQSVDMVNLNDGWAVGDSGIIIRWDGVTWKNVTSPIPAGKHLFSVNIVNSTDGWAVGSDGVIIHWDGASWSNVASPTGAWLSCVDMVSSTDGWIVGADGVYRWQEVAGFPTACLVVIIAVVIVVVVCVWFFRRNRQAHTRTERVVPTHQVSRSKGMRETLPLVLRYLWCYLPVLELRNRYA
jgi:hypothetical protein